MLQVREKKLNPENACVFCGKPVQKSSKRKLVKQIIRGSDDNYEIKLILEKSHPPLRINKVNSVRIA